MLGGTQSLHTNSLDETLALPTEETARIALRTQQIIAHESGVINTVDPLGGCWFIEELTDRMEEGCFDYFRRSTSFGGMVEAIEAGFPQREIMDAAFAYQRAVEAKEKLVVGVNAFQLENEPPIDILYIVGRPRRAADRVPQRGQEHGATRGAVERTLEALRNGAAGRRQHHAADHRLREGLRHGGGDQRRPARRLRHLPGAGGLLGCYNPPP